METSSPARKNVQRALLGISILGALATFALGLVPLIAGTFISNGRVGLRDLAYVSVNKYTA
jgi:hypothetical protein